MAETSTAAELEIVKNQAKLPLVYSCSGVSSAAQMDNHIAVKMDRLQAAAMLERIVKDSKVPVPPTSVAATPTPSPRTSEEELPEPSSPVCYAKDFKEW